MEKVELDIVIVPEGEGESRVYSISSVQVPNVVTQGKTVEEAKKRLKEALELYLDIDIKLELKKKLGKKVDLLTYKSIHPYIKKNILADEIKII